MQAQTIQIKGKVEGVSKYCIQVVYMIVKIAIQRKSHLG